MMTLLQRDVGPFFIGFFALTAATIGIDFLLHQWGLPWIGRYLGLAGVVVIAAGLAPYSLRKRNLVIVGDATKLLRLHEVTAWIGALLITVHAGIHFNTILPWLALALMLATVASGLAGQLLFGRARRHFEERRASLQKDGLSPSEVEQKLFWDALTLDLTKKWRLRHSVIALVFVGLAFAHILTALIFWSWL
jgi:hypothetical protein